MRNNRNNRAVRQKRAVAGTNMQAVTAIPAPSQAFTQTVITDARNCCAAPETLAEEFYGAAIPEILATGCYDPLRGPQTADALYRCTYWPRFAHPRWLTCRELYSRHL